MGDLFYFGPCFLSNFNFACLFILSVFVFSCLFFVVSFFQKIVFSQVWVARNPPGFAFVWFADERDATDAVRETDGRSIAGREWRVEIVSSDLFTT